MTSQYIIKFINNDYETEGYVELYKNKANVSTITIRTHKDPKDEANQTLLHKFMTNNFAKVVFDDNTTNCTISYKDGNSRNVYTSTIQFDSNSSSAYSDFAKRFTEMYNSKYETEYYPSGREAYVGEVLYKKGKDDVVVGRSPNGKGTVYYDLPGYKIKYSGEFENGLYDGAGIFYSQDNKISLIAKNISAGIPTQKARLVFNYSKRKDTIEIAFNEVWDRYNISDKIMRKNIILSDSFVSDLAKSYWTPNDIPMEALVFQDKSIDDKYLEIWNTLRVQDSKLNQLVFDNNNNQEKNKLLLYILFTMSTSLILFTTIISQIL
jgi:hypothetical protein